MATYAIGDIQGCFDSFQRLLERCRFVPGADRLWLVGDLVNRGPRSLETLRYVRDLGDSALTVLGNHDLYLIMVAHGAARKRGGDDTIGAILDAPDRDALIDWLRHRPLCHTQGKYCLVHAGLLPQWSIQQARALAGEVEAALQGAQHAEFIHHMWGSEPNGWSADLQGWGRLRVIVNAMTRLRFCTDTGVMDFKTKGEAATAPPGYQPWFEVAGRQSAADILVTGHWSALGFKRLPNLLALDSGCVWGNQLTAVRLEDQAVFQVECSPQEACALDAY